MFIRWFWKRNKLVTVIFVLSFVLVLSHVMILDLCELIITDYVHILSFIEQLLIAYMGAFIFYVIQTAYSDYKSWKTFSSILIPKMKKIRDLIKGHINILAQKYLEEEVSVNNLTEKDLKEIIGKLSLGDELPLFDESGRQKNILEELIIHKTLVKENIYDIYRVLGSDLEEKTQELINNIAESNYFKEIEYLEHNKLGNQNVRSKEAFTDDSKVVAVGVFKMIDFDSKGLYSYYLLIQELDQYIQTYEKS